MLTSQQRRAAADALARAEQARAPIERLTITHPGIDLVDAYEIQLLQIRDKLAAGRLVRGHKVGLSSKAMQQMMSVHEPDYGHLLDDMFVFENTDVDTSQFLVPRVEVEVAFVLDDALPAPGCTAADVMRATAYVCPAIEIIDSRFHGWQIQICDTIADNASSARVVLGGAPTRLDQIDPRLIGAVLRLNGEVVATGASGAVLGNPVTAVAWLANKVHAFGVTLEAGNIVLPGSCTRAFGVGAGTTVRAEFDRLGHVAVKFV